jgi:hypothetical protein
LNLEIYYESRRVCVFRLIRQSAHSTKCRGNFCYFVKNGIFGLWDAKMDDYIKITVIENTIEAQLIDSVLSEKKIPHRMRSFHDTAYDGLFQFQKGWGELYAPLKLKNEILEIIENLRTE